MRKLSEFIKRHINESFDKMVVSNINGVFIVNDKKPVVISAPATYNESDVQIYLDDVLLKEYPGDNTNAENFFGKDNVDNIIDTYFEYSKFERVDNYDGELTLEWDSHYDNNVNDKTEMGYFTLYDVKYIIKFSEFLLNAQDEQHALKDIEDLLRRSESNYLNKYKVDIKFEKLDDK